MVPSPGWFAIKYHYWSRNIYYKGWGCSIETSRRIPIGLITFQPPDVRVYVLGL